MKEEATATAASTVPPQDLSDPGSQQVLQGRAIPYSSLALGGRPEQVKSGPLSLSGVEKCRDSVEELQDL